jgi:hypothetical protein
MDLVVLIPQGDVFFKKALKADCPVEALSL